MIFEFLATAVTAVLTTIIGILPAIPPMPQAIIDSGTFVLTILGASIGFIVAIYSQPLFVALMLVLLILFQFEHLYHLVLWVIRKIPVSIH